MEDRIKRFQKLLYDANAKQKNHSKAINHMQIPKKTNGGGQCTKLVCNILYYIIVCVNREQAFIATDYRELLTITKSPNTSQIRNGYSAFG